MKLKQNKTQVYLLLIFSLALLIGVGYAALSATLKINGQTTINKASWDVHMENINVTTGSVEATSPTLDDAKTTVNFSVTLTNPGDFYEFTVKEVNKGTIDAMISTISKTGLTETQAKYLDYTVTYDSGLSLAQNQILKSGNSEYLRVKVAFKKDVTASDLPTADSTLNLNFSLSYQQAESNAVTLIHPTCKRATTLHTEICNQTDTKYYCSGGGYTKGSTVTYGNLGTKGTLTSGDAFDCDVNGDGVFDPSTERFYYVSDLDTDSKYAVLIYYNNVSGGAPNNTKAYAYDSNSRPRENGPVTGKVELPTITQWDNVSLANTNRKIKDEKNTEYIDFSYQGYAARLLTSQEVAKACGITVGSSKIGELDNCKYLMENTKYTNNSLLYGYWLESVHSSNADNSWFVSGYSRVYNYSAGVAINYGVRPAIEVLKSKVSY